MKKGERKVFEQAEVLPPEGGEIEPAKPGRIRQFKHNVSFDYVASCAFGGGRPGPAIRGRLIDVLRNCGDREIQEIVRVWDNAKPSERAKLKIETICERVNVDCDWVIEKVAGTIYRLSGDVTKLIVGLNQPEVVQYTIKQALKPDGHRDRKMFLEGSGFLPKPVTQFGLMVNNNQYAPNQPQPPAGAPAAAAGVTNIATVEELNAVDQQYDRKGDQP